LDSPKKGLSEAKSPAGVALIASALKTLARNENDDISSAGSFNEADWGDEKVKRSLRRPTEPNANMKPSKSQLPAPIPQISKFATQRGSTIEFEDMVM